MIILATERGVTVLRGPSATIKFDELQLLRLPPDFQGGVMYRNQSDECWIALNPTNPKNLIMCTHQDNYAVTGYLADVVYFLWTEVKHGLSLI